MAPIEYVSSEVIKILYFITSIFVALRFFVKVLLCYLYFGAYYFLLHLVFTVFYPSVGWPLPALLLNRTVKQYNP
jgi:hypothetical protein